MERLLDRRRPLAVSVSASSLASSAFATTWPSKAASSLGLSLPSLPCRSPCRPPCRPRTGLRLRALRAPRPFGASRPCGLSSLPCGLYPNPLDDPLPLRPPLASWEYLQLSPRSQLPFWKAKQMPCGRLPPSRPPFIPPCPPFWSLPCPPKDPPRPMSRWSPRWSPLPMRPERTTAC